MLTLIFYIDKVIDLLKTSSIHLNMGTLPLLLWHLKSVVSFLIERGLWQTFGVPGPSCGWRWCCVDEFCPPHCKICFAKFLLPCFTLYLLASTLLYIQINIHNRCKKCFAHTLFLFFALLPMKLFAPYLIKSVPNVALISWLWLDIGE